MAVRGDIRNVAIVAHVDHGKTTLVNAMLQQSHVFSEREEVPDRVMDSNDLEREKGITILAKNTAVQYTGPLAEKYGHPEGITINVIDTPGHADFGGEVERGISMVDGVVLLVDASEGPLPQTRFVLRKALEARLPVILCVNKVDRPDARIEEVVGEATDLLLGLAQDVIEEGVDLDLDSLLDLPVIYCAAKAGYASTNQPENGGLPDNDNLEPLFDSIISNIPAPEYEEGAPLQAHVTNIDASDYLGRLGLVRIYNGTLVKGKQYGLSRVDGTIENFKLTEILRTKGLDRFPVEQAGPGDIVAIAGVVGRHGGQGSQAHRPHDQRSSGPRADRQRVDPRAADRASGRLGGTGTWRTRPGGARRADASRRLRADRRPSAGGHQDHRRPGLRADGEHHHRRARGVYGHRHPADGRP